MVRLECLDYELAFGPEEAIYGTLGLALAAYCVWAWRQTLPFARACKPLVLLGEYDPILLAFWLTAPAWLPVALLARLALADPKPKLRPHQEAAVADVPPSSGKTKGTFTYNKIEFDALVTRVTHEELPTASGTRWGVVHDLADNVVTITVHGPRDCRPSAGTLHAAARLVADEAERLWAEKKNKS